MATMEEMRMDLEMMKEFIMKQGDEITRLKKIGNIDEENCNIERESVMSHRLYDIEFQLSEQKRSTTKITKLCMAAIKALEKLEQKPGLLEVASFDDCSIASKESDNAVDPMMLKTLCEQMDVINKLLIKVDDDIEAVDQKAEDGLSECEKIEEQIKAIEKGYKDRCDTLMGEMRALLVSKTYATREDLTRSLKTIPLPISKEEIEGMIQRAKEELSKTFVTQKDVSKQIQSIPNPLKKEDVSEMIDRATSNFLRTVHAETANCVEKTQDCEELVKAELQKLKSSVVDMESVVRNETQQIKENTEKNIKEVSRSLANQQNKVNSQNVDNYERLNKRIDNEIESLGAMVKEMPKEENKGIDEAKFNTRMERLGKEISLMKAKQTELSQSIENSTTKQTQLEKQQSNTAITIENHNKEVKKVADVEMKVTELSKKIESNGKLYEKAIEECQRKIDRTEMDDLRNGMEKERCKINYFQDKISNIAKSVDGVKIENNNMRDKFCADIEGHDNSIKSLEQLIGSHSKQLSENSTALKGITLDSIGKIKDVANNCVQVEMNIRSIRDKSILFDNDLKQIKDQISHMKFENGSSQSQQQQNFEKDIMKLVKQRDEDLKVVNEGISSMKKKLNQNTADLNNLKEDKRTKEGENEERQSSLEQNLLDVRSYVETMLNDTNTQLNHIAIDVDNANLKITKCASDIGEVFHKHANHTGDFTFVIKNLEDKLKDLQELGNVKQNELLEKILELRTSFVDTQSEFVGKLQLSNESITKLRDDSLLKIEKLENQIKKNFESHNLSMNKANQSINDLKTKQTPEISDINLKLEAFKVDNERAKVDIKKCIEEGKVNNSKVIADIACLQKADESHQKTMKNVAENLAKIEGDLKVKNKEVIDKFNEFKMNIDKSHKDGDSLRKELDTRMENIRKGLIEMIGLNEIKTSELEDNLNQVKYKVDDMNVVQNNIQMNLENKLKATKDSFESALSDNNKTKALTSSDIETKVATLKRDVDQVRNELKIGDLENFKSVVNHTTETHNKLITEMQKNVDLMVCEKTILESQIAVLDSRVSDIFSEKDDFESTIKESIQKESEEYCKTKDEMLTLQSKLENFQENIDLCQQINGNMNNLTSSLKEAKAELSSKISENLTKINSLEDGFNYQLKTLEDKLSSGTKIENDMKFLKNLTSNLQESSNEMKTKIQGNNSKIHELDDMLNCELKNLKNSVASNGKSLQDKFMSEFREVTKNIQDKSSLAETQLNEALEMIHNHTRVIDSLTESVAQVNKTSDSSDSQIQKIELKLTSCIEELSKLDQFVMSPDLKKVERSILEKVEKAESNEVDKKVTSLKQELLEMLKEVSNKYTYIEQMISDLEAKVSNDRDLSGLPDEVQMLSSKVSHQKAKIIDMEANITMHERSTTKLSDEVKKLNTQLSNSINKLEDKLDKASKQGISNEEKSSKKLGTNIQNGFDNGIDLHELEKIISKLETKSATWDRKADNVEIDKMKTMITDEVNKIQKEIKDIMKNNEVVKLQLKEAKEDKDNVSLSKNIEENYIKKNELKAIDQSLVKLTEHVHKTLANNITKLESKLSNFESFEKDSITKLSDLSKNNEKIFTELVTLSNLKSKFESKASSWDCKVDTVEMKKLNTLLNDEVKKLKKDIALALEKNDEIKSNIKTNATNVNEESFTKKLENKFVSKEDFKAADIKLSNLCTEFNDANKTMKASFAKYDNNIAEINKLKQDTNSTNSKNLELKQQIEKMNGDITSFVGMKSRFDSNANIWDKKANCQDIEKIEKEFKHQLESINRSINDIVKNNDDIKSKVNVTEMQNNLSNSVEQKINKDLEQINTKLSKLGDELESYSNLHANFNSKAKVWDSKADMTEIKKLDACLKDEVNSLKKDIAYVLEKNDELNQNIKETNVRESQASESRSLEDKITKNIANLENKIAVISKSKDDLSAKSSEMSERLDKLNNDLSPVFDMRSKIESKSSLWDNKADTSEMLNIKSSVNDELDKIRKNVDYLFDKSDKFDEKIGTLSKYEKEENVSKSFENKVNSSIANIENKIATIDQSRENTHNDLKEQKSQIDNIKHDLTSYGDLKTAFAAKRSIWDGKADLDDVKKLNTLVDSEMKKMKEMLEELSEKNNDLDIKLKNDLVNKSEEECDKNVEKRLLANIAQIDNKIAILEQARNSSATKLSELFNKYELMSTDLSNLSNTVPKKQNLDELDKVVKEIKSELKDLKKNMEYVLENNDAMKSSLQTSLNSSSSSSELETTLLDKIGKVENKMAIIENSQKSNTNKLTDVTEKTKNMVADVNTFSEFRNKLESKVNIWDQKADVSDLKKIDTSINEDIKKIKVDIEHIVEKNEDFSIQNLNKKFISMDEFRGLEGTVSELSQQVSKNDKNESGKTYSQDLEAKMKKLEASNGDLQDKFGNLMEKNSDLNNQIVSLSTFKSKMDSKTNFWDSKVDTSELERIEKHLGVELNSLKENVSSVENKSVENWQRLDKSHTEVYSKLNDLTKNSENQQAKPSRDDLNEIDKIFHDEIKKVKEDIERQEEKNRKSYEEIKDMSKSNLNDMKLKDFIEKEEFTILDINVSKLSEIVENIQGEVFEHQSRETSQLEQFETKMNTMKAQIEDMKNSSIPSDSSANPSGITDLVRTIQSTIGNLEANMNTLKADVPSRRELEKMNELIEEKINQMDRSTPSHGYENALTSIDKQRRGWEEAREKAEEMAQIFDSLIITNDRPYVSCGLDAEMNESGLLEFSQFELINKVAFDTDTNHFSLLEPGVYLLQMAGSLQGGRLVAKLVSEEVAVDFMIIEAGRNGGFKSRSTIFTIEDDDQTVESLMVELMANGEGDVKLDNDFSFLMYKISEVSTTDQMEQ